MDTQAPTAPVEGWLARNALHLVVALLVALFGWSANRTLDGVAADIAVNTARLERLAESLGGVLVDQASQERRIEQGAADVARLERRLDHLEARLDRSPGRPPPPPPPDR